tara:strand:+ start:911 stop:1411 length:501 start_codon:yes stop_codon:yes gene_type:complete
MKLTTQQIKQIIREELAMITEEEIDYESLEYLKELIQSFDKNYKNFKDKEQLLERPSILEKMLESVNQIYHFIEIIMPNAPEMPSWFDKDRYQQDKLTVGMGADFEEKKELIKNASTKYKIKYEAAYDGLLHHVFILRDYFTAQIVPHIEKMANKNTISKMDFTKQ